MQEHHGVNAFGFVFKERDKNRVPKITQFPTAITQQDSSRVARVPAVPIFSLRLEGRNALW
jgi:hypothetical protein